MKKDRVASGRLTSGVRSLGAGLGLVVFLTLGLAVAPASAQRVEPMVFSLTPTGGGSSTTVRMDNLRSVPMTVETAVHIMVIDEDGRETWQPGDDDFQVFPPQSIIQPGQSQAFRVRYVGDPALAESRAYRFALMQLPIALPEGQSGMAIGIDFNTLMTVVPPSSRSDMVVAALTPEGDDGWAAVLENRGSRYVRLTRTDWTFRAASGAETTKTGFQLFGDLERNMVPAGATRRIQIKRPAEMVGAGDVTITIAAPPTE